MERIIRVGLGFAGGALVIYGAIAMSASLILRFGAITVGTILAYYGLKGK
jgi:hypothetical protein